MLIGEREAGRVRPHVRSASLHGLRLVAEREPVLRMAAVCCLTLLAALAALPQAYGSDWVIQTVDSSGKVGGYTSLSLDSTNTPHIAYYDYNNTALKYAYCTGSAWQALVVDDLESVGQHCSLKVDGQGRPSVAYQDGTNDDLKYAAYNGTTWSVTTVASNGQTGFWPSMALDLSGRPHISYSEGGLRYASWNGSSWEFQTVSSQGGTSSLAIDSLGHPHIAFVDGTHQDRLQYASWNGSSWVTETIATLAGHTVMYTSLVLDPSDRPRISYMDNAAEALWFAQDNGQSWTNEMVDNYGRAGLYTSLALDSDGDPWIGYKIGRTDSSSYLKLARWDGHDWSIETVDSQAGGWCSLAIGAYDLAHFAYMDQANMDLKYAYEVPEPSALTVIGLGGAVLALGRRLRKA